MSVFHSGHSCLETFKNCIQSVFQSFIYPEDQSFLETHFVDIRHMSLETVLAFETVAN